MRAVSPHRATITVSGLFVMGVLLGSWAGRAAVARATDPYAGLERFARMLTAIESDYVVPIDNQLLVDAAIRGMVQELDPHSRWMSVEEVQELRADAEGETTGFGVEIEIDPGGVKVKRVLAGSPAQREGLRAEDRLLSIDGKKLVGLPLKAVQALLEGARGEAAEFEILREGWDAPQKLSTQRDVVKEPALEVHRFGPVLYVRFIDFQRGSAQELGQALAAESKLEGLILDLRDNTGGLLSEAVGVADLFLDEGPIVSVRGRRDTLESHQASRKSAGRGLRVAVLINHYSASASEIVAGALQETGIATLIGTPTYGKGSVQQLYRNPDGSALKLTIAAYHLPSGKTIVPGEGLQPDVPVEVHQHVQPSDALKRELDTLDLPPKRRASLHALIERMQDPKPTRHAIRWSLSPERRAEEDPVIRAALKHLR